MRPRSVALVGFSLLALASCASPLYKVSPLPAAPAPAAPSTSGGGLQVGATAYSEDLALQHFDANLPLAGVIAVEIRIANRTAQTIPLQGLSFSLQDAAAHSFGLLAPKKALSLVMKYEGVSLYGKEAYKRTIEAYESIAFPREGAFDPGGEKRGVLFFSAKGSAADPNALNLVIKGGPAPISLQLH